MKLQQLKDYIEDLYTFDKNAGELEVHLIIKDTVISTETIPVTDAYRGIRKDINKLLIKT